MLCGIVVTTLQLGSVSSHAQLNEWVNTLGGNWYDGTRWSNGIPGVSTTGAEIDLNVSVELLDPALDIQLLRLGVDETPTFTIRNNGSLNVNGVSMGINAGGYGTLNVHGINASLDVGTNHFVVGESGSGILNLYGGAEIDVISSTRVGVNQGSSGQLSLSDSPTVLSTDFLEVGVAGFGRVEMQAGSEIITNQMILGWFSTGVGVTGITGLNTSLNVNFLDVGNFGNGTLVVEDLATLSVAADALLGVESGSFGEITVTGSVPLSTVKSSLLTDGHTQVGVNGEGSLQVLDGGRVLAADISFAVEDGSEGSGLIQGLGSVVESNASVFLGRRGLGELQILDGGSLNADTIYLGFESDSNGQALLSGSLSNINTTGSMFIGQAGAGTVDLLDGTFLQVEDELSIGNLSPGEGVLNVEGADAFVAVGGDLNVGAAGTGEFRLLNGANSQIGGNITIGSTSTGNGTLEVRGGDSLLDALGNNLVVGNFGTGNLQILDGGAVEVTGATTVGSSDSGDGQVEIHGAGSRMETEGSLLIGLLGTGLVSIESGGSLVASGSVFPSNSVMIAGVGAGSSGTMEMDGGNFTALGGVEIGREGVGELTATNGSALDFQEYLGVGLADGSNGLVELTDGSEAVVQGETVVGVSGTGRISLIRGSTLTTTDDIRLGVGETGNGLIVADFTGTSLSTSGSIFVGIEGIGELAVNSNAFVQSASLFAGQEIGSEGQVALSGADLTTGQFYLGQVGKGDFFGNVSTIITGSTYLGTLASGEGKAELFGNSTNWSNADLLEIGGEGEGRLILTDSATLSTQTTILGSSSGSLGVVELSDFGTSFTQSNAIGASMVVGAAGRGEVEVREGAIGRTLGNSGLLLGQAASGFGELLVDGIDSEFTVISATTVGSFGSGFITVSNGGFFQTQGAAVGNNSGASGTISVTGVGSEWNSVGTTFGSIVKIGNLGDGTLNVSNGAKVDIAATLYAGESAGGKGIINVNGTGAFLKSGNIVEIGRFGTGELNISSGGKVETPNPTLAAQAGSTGSALISGAGSEWDVTTRLTIGGTGEASVIVNSGGTLKAITTIGQNGGGGDGLLQVFDTGSQWLFQSSTGGGVNIGLRGKGRAEVFNGGTAEGNSIVLGVSSGGDGSLLVSGSDSSLTLDGTLRTGQSGAGSVSVTNGASMTSRDGSIAYENTGTGEVSILNGASWYINGTTINDQLIVGRRGQGTLLIGTDSFVGVTSSAIVGGHATSLDTSEGTVNVAGSGAVFTVLEGITIGTNSGATGTINVANNALVNTSGIVKGVAAATAAFNLDGGELRLVGNQANLFGGFSANEVQLLAGGGTINTQGFEVGSDSSIAGVGGLEKTGAGKLALTGTNTYVGHTTISQGTFMIDDNGSINETAGITIDGAELQYSSSVDYEGGTVDFISGTLSGTNWQGNLTNLTIGSNQRISPGNSVGEAIGESQTWTGGGTLVWEINNATGMAGGPSGWDLITFTDTLTLSATSLTPFVIEVTSLQLDNTPGQATNFDPDSNYQWLIAQSQEEIDAFDEVFSVNGANFSNPSNGLWSVVRGDVIGEGTNEMYLTYFAIPEPGTGALFIAGLIGALLARRTRRNEKH